MKHSKKIGLFLFLYTRGELSPSEYVELRNWRNQDPENEKLFFQMTDPDSLRLEMQVYYKERDQDFEKFKTRLSFLSGTSLTGFESEGQFDYFEADLLEEKDQTEFSGNHDSTSGLSPVKYWGSLISDPEDVVESKSGISPKGKVIDMNPETETPKITTKEKIFKWIIRAACVVFFATKIYPHLPKSNSDRFRASLFSSDAVDKAAADMSRGFEVGKAGIKISHNADGDRIYIIPNERKAPYKKTYQLRTPEDGEVILQLPDSTLIWLNGSSTVKYPANFDQQNIAIEITGEVYVEKSKDSFHQYHIIGLAPNKERLTVNAGPLSRFDLNAYADDEGLLVTLISGDAGIVSDSTVKEFHFTNGIQAVFKYDSLSNTRSVDTLEIISWRNGTFYYRDAPIQRIMPAIARWYDMDVQYAYRIPDKKFNLRMERSASLTDILKSLQNQGLHVTHLGKNITIWR